MEICSILVNLDVDFFSPAVLDCAAKLAQRFSADLIGVAAVPLSQSLIGINDATAYAAYYEQERTDIQNRLRTLEGEFRSLAPSNIKLEWHSFMAAPNDSLLSIARQADLIVTASHIGESNYPRSVNAGELVLGAGRPVLVAGAGVDEIVADKVAIGWKDTREARRAVVDALPFLKAASDVLVASINEGDLLGERTSLDSVLAWLRRHGVKARGEVYPLTGTAGETLVSLGRQSGADLIITGAYGHSRVREWFLGGMTRDLLNDPTVNRLMSN